MSSGWNFQPPRIWPIPIGMVVVWICIVKVSSEGTNKLPHFQISSGNLVQVLWGHFIYVSDIREGGVVRLRVTANSSVLWSRIRKGSLDNNIESYWDYHCNRQAAFLTDQWSHKTIIWYSSIRWRPLSELGLLKENFHSISWRSPLMIMKFLV